MEPDNSWQDWASIAANAQDSADYICVACVTAADKAVQGAMLYTITGHSLFAPGESAAEISLLAAAPRNRRIGPTVGKYRGTGSSLLFWAVVHSFILGSRGRIVLESKPAAQTIQFYEKRGLKAHSRTPNGMINMELEPESALKWIRDEGLSL